MAQTISTALYNAVTKNKNIQNIYFTGKGAFYFSAFTVSEKQKDGSTKPILYARTTEVKTAVPGQTLANVTTAGVAETAITETLTRAALLALKPETPATAVAK